MASREGGAADGGRGQLLRILGVAFGLAAVVGGVVGQGIFRTPGLVAGAVPDPWLILTLWTLGGLLVLIDACAMVELSSSIQRAGGPYVYALRAFGRVPGTVIGWADLLLWIIVVAFLSVVFGEYVHRLGIARDVPIGLLSAALIAACWLVNWTGTRISGASQTIFSAFKGIVLIVLVVALASKSGPLMAADAAPPAALTPLTIVALLAAMRAIVNTYAGWGAGAYFNEEIVDAGRNMARSIFGGLALCMVLYVAVNAAMLHVLTPAEMAQSELPAADAAAAVLGPQSGVAMTAIALFSIVALTNLALMVVSRIGYALARGGVLPGPLCRVAERGTPRAALTAAAALAAAFALSGTYEWLIGITVPLTLLTIGSCDLAAIAMRYREPDLPRPFKMPLFPVPAVVGLALNLALLVALFIDDPRTTGIGLGAAVVLGIGYALFGRSSRGGNEAAA